MLAVSHSLRYSLQKITTTYLNLSNLCPCPDKVSCENGIVNDVTITLSCVSIDGTFYNFSVTQIFRIIPAKNYEKLSKSVEVTVIILSVPFSGHGVNWHVSMSDFFRLWPNCTLKFASPE